MLRNVLWSAALASLLCSPAVAQVNSVTRGFSLGAHVQGANLDPEDNLNDNGGGLGLDLGYGFQRPISLFLTIAVAAMQPDEDKAGASYALSEFDLGARYSFRGEQARWRPYVEGVLTTMLATFEDVQWGGDPGQDVEIQGPAFSVGGGAEYFMAPQWSLGLGVRWSSGSFDEVKVGNVTVELDPEDQFDVSTSRFQVGIRYHFSQD